MRPTGNDESASVRSPLSRFRKRFATVIFFVAILEILGLGVVIAEHRSHLTRFRLLRRVHRPGIMACKAAAFIAVARAAMWMFGILIKSARGWSPLNPRGFRDISLRELPGLIICTGFSIAGVWLLETFRGLPPSRDGRTEGLGRLLGVIWIMLGLYYCFYLKNRWRW